MTDESQLRRPARTIEEKIEYLNLSFRERRYEEGAVLVKEAEKKIPMKIEEGKLYIGDMPQLIVDLDTQENYIRTDGTS